MAGVAIAVFSALVDAILMRYGALFPRLRSR
jgi:hypothetical protein